MDITACHIKNLLTTYKSYITVFFICLYLYVCMLYVCMLYIFNEKRKDILKGTLMQI